MSTEHHHRCEACGDARESVCDCDAPGDNKFWRCDYRVPGERNLKCPSLANVGKENLTQLMKEEYERAREARPKEATNV